MSRAWLLLAAVLGLFANAAAAERPTLRDRETPGVRLFVMQGGDKHYLTGFDWLQFDIGQKMGLVEAARSQAAGLNAVMVLPAEVYVAELDRMFSQNPEVRHIEIGPALQGVAITLKDWDDGSNPREKLAAYTDPD